MRRPFKGGRILRCGEISRKYSTTPVYYARILKQLIKKMLRDFVSLTCTCTVYVQVRCQSAHNKKRGEASLPDYIVRCTPHPQDNFQPPKLVKKNAWRGNYVHYYGLTTTIKNVNIHQQQPKFSQAICWLWEVDESSQSRSVMNGGQLPTNLLHDINQGALDHASRAPQLTCSA